MIVYRYENERGMGPYWSYGLPDMFRVHNETGMDLDSKQPGGNIDGLARLRGPDSHYACPSIPALNEWFKGWEVDLEKAGYRVAAYQVDDRFVIFGRSARQVLFNKAMAIKLEV